MEFEETRNKIKENMEIVENEKIFLKNLCKEECYSNIEDNVNELNTLFTRRSVIRKVKMNEVQFVETDFY